MSRREYKVINRRLQRGRLLSVNEGKYVGNVAPYGYDREKLSNDKGFTLIENEEARVVRLIFDLYVKNNYSMNEIAKELNKRNIPTRKSKQWIAPTVKCILHNPVYIGKIRWNSRKTVRRMENGIVYKTRPRSRDYTLVDGLHKPLINEEIWNRAQNKITLNHIPLPEDKTLKNPLRSLIICKKCGNPMQRRPYKKAGLPATLICTTPNCDNISSKFDIVEEMLLEGLKQWLKDFKINSSNNDAINKKYNIQVREVEKEIEKYEQKLLKTDKKLEKVYSFLEEGIYNKDEFLDRKNQIDIEKNNMEDNIKKLQRKIKDIKEMIDNKISLIPNLENVIEIYYSLDSVKEKNELLKTVIEKVTYLKTEKAIKKESDPKKFELNIFPKVY